MCTRIILVFTFIFLCNSACSSKNVALDENLETIPKDIALEYLQNTSNTYTDDRCLYTKNGVEGIPYSNLEFEALSNIWGNNYMILWTKGKKQRFTAGLQENTTWICTPLNIGGVGGYALSRKEGEEVFHRTASALTAMGTGMVK